MGAKEKITWITCPDCGGKIGIVISVGDKPTITHREKEPTTTPQPQQTTETTLKNLGIDTTQIEIEENTTTITIKPKKFLGDQWTPINDTIKTLNGTWIRDGKNSHWKITKNK